MTGVLEHAHALRKDYHTPQHERGAEANEWQGSTVGTPSAAPAVMMVTPVAYVPSALRKSLGSISELSLANSFAGSGLNGCFGASVMHQPQSVRFSDGRPSATRPKLVPAASKLNARCELIAWASRNCRCNAAFVNNPRAPLAENNSDTASVQRLTAKAPSRRNLVLAATSRT